jgi:outer membrane protein assembly factor BamB
MLNAIDEMTGRILWQHATNGGVWGAVASDINTNTVFTMVGNPSNQVISLNATTGALNWTFNMPNSGPDDDPGSGIVVASGPGLVYINSKNGTLYALHESDGSLAWATPIGPANIGNVSTPALGPDGTLYVGSLDNHLYSINSLTGAILRATTIGNGIDSSPAIANGVVYFASFDKNIYAMNASTGAILWSFATTGRSYSSPVIVNGWLYCNSTDGHIYAFSL